VVVFNNFTGVEKRVLTEGITCWYPLYNPPCITMLEAKPTPCLPPTMKATVKAMTPFLF
jgi:hypothetical protein